MTLEERRRRGAELIEQMLGPERGREVRDTWREIAPEFESYVTEFLAGEVWSRTQLDLRTKSLVTVAALTALGRTRGLELNIEMAARNGATRQDLVETLLQIAPYAGFPASWEGLAMVARVFDGKRDEQP